jgi:hypothetical protein
MWKNYMIMEFCFHFYNIQGANENILIFWHFVNLIVTIVFFFLDFSSRLSVEEPQKDLAIDGDSRFFGKTLLHLVIYIITIQV